MKILTLALVLGLVSSFSLAQTPSTGTAHNDEEALRSLHGDHLKPSRDKASVKNYEGKERKPNPQNLRLGDDPFINNLGTPAERKK